MKSGQVSIRLGKCSAVVALALAAGVSASVANESNAGHSSRSLPSIAPSSEATVAGNVARNLVHVSTATVRHTVGGVLDAAQYRVETTPATTSVACPNTAADGCVITATVTVQLAGTLANNRAWLCFVIDNVTVAPECPYVGLVSQNSRFQAFSFPFAKYTVAAGTRKLQARFGFEKDTIVGSIHVQYDVYR